MNRFQAALIVTLLLSPLFIPKAAAAVTLSTLFSDHMVLQRDAETPFWGTASPNETVTVTAGALTASTTAGADGKWTVKLGKMSASATPITVTVKGTNTVTIEDVLIGDVWVCSGQSNMALPLSGSSGAGTEIPAADNPNLRLFQVPARAFFKPQETTPTKWTQCTPATAKNFPAVGYYFGKEIASAVGVPVGLIGAPIGGTPAQAWTSLEGLQADPLLKKTYADDFVQKTSDPEALKAAHDKWLAEGGGAYQESVKKWQIEAWQAQQKGETAPPKPAPYATPEPVVEGQKGLPTVLFNAMIAPLIPYAIKGVVWYQGESNVGTPYRQIFPAMIADWRRHWGQGDFPFIYVQLPNYGPRNPDASATHGWPMIREVQLQGLAIPNTAMAITIDAGDGKELHPPYKDIVGHRLALAARRLVYGEKIIASGPLFDSLKIEGNKAVVTFKEVGTGLKIGTLPVTPPNSTPPPTDRLVGFALAGDDKKFRWASASITAPDTVTVSCPEVPVPVFVRYGWNADPEVNLYNNADLPASPFRTDGP